MLMVVRQLVCHEAVGALQSIVSGEGKAELHRRHRGKRQESLMLWSKGIVEGQRKAFIGKEGRRGGSRGEAVERSRRHEAVLLVLDLSLQFHPPVLKPGLDLDLRELQGGRQLPSLRGSQVLLALKGLLQPAHLLRAEGGPRPPLPPAAPTRRLRFRALPASALALVARGLVGAQPAAVRGWLRRRLLAGLLGTAPALPLRAGLASRGLFRPRTPPSGLGPGQEGIAAAALRGGGAGRGNAADVGPHPMGFGLCQGKVGLAHGGEGLGLPASISSYTGAPVRRGLVCKCEATSKWESSRDNSYQ